MYGMLFGLIFFGIPLGMIVFFGDCLYRYVSAKRKNKEEPGSFPEEEMKKRKTMMIVSAVAAGVVVAVVVGFLAMLVMAIAYM